MRAYIGGAVAVAVAAAVPSSAQIIVMIPTMSNEDSQRLCVLSPRPPEDQIAEVRAPAVESMQRYWQRVSSAETAGITSLFQRRGRAEWAIGEQTRRRNGLGAIHDPLAHQAGVMLDAEPITFERGLEGMTARGLWAVRGADGAIAGHYLVDFRRELHVWYFARIEVLPAPVVPPAVTPYCQDPGDVERLRVVVAERDARRAARQAARKEARAVAESAASDH